MKFTLKFVIAVVAVCVIFAAGFAWYAHSRGVQSGKSEILLLWDSERMLGLGYVKARETELTNNYLEAINEAKQREVKLAASLAAANRTADGLRVQLTEAHSRLSAATCQTVREYAATVNELFGECVGAYQGMAGQADGHASDALMLQEAWPKYTAP